MSPSKWWGQVQTQCAHWQSSVPEGTVSSGGSCPNQNISRGPFGPFCVPGQLTQWTELHWAAQVLQESSSVPNSSFSSLQQLFWLVEPFAAHENNWLLAVTKFISFFSFPRLQLPFLRLSKHFSQSFLSSQLCWGLLSVLCICLQHFWTNQTHDVTYDPNRVE